MKLQSTTRPAPCHAVRDEELRSAHQRAFKKIHEARSSNDHRLAVSEAVRELIDACEAYTRPKAV